MIRFFWRFLVISGLGSRIYIVKSAILSFWVFLSTFLHEITLKAIDIDNIGCLEPFLPLWEHFWNWVSVELNCALDLTPRLKDQASLLSIALRSPPNILEKVPLRKMAKDNGLFSAIIPPPQNSPTIQSLIQKKANVFPRCNASVDTYLIFVSFFYTGKIFGE